MNKGSGLPDSRAGARLRQQPFSLCAKCASPGGFYFIGNKVSYKARKDGLILADCKERRLAPEQPTQGDV